MHQHEDGPPTMEFVNIGAILSGDSSADPLVLDNWITLPFTCSGAGEVHAGSYSCCERRSRGALGPTLAPKI